jgi:DNA-binding NarL/FixJ family response regulator
MDVSMQGLNGIDASSQILKTNPEIKIIALSMHSTKHFVTGMFQAGAWGYLLKDCATEELVTAIKTVLSGKKYISQYISGIILDEYLSGSGTDKDSSLSDREREILQLIAEGQSVKTISDKLSLSAKTIETHRKNIMDKLKIYTIPELTKYAIRNGITSLDS